VQAIRIGPDRGRINDLGGQAQPGGFQTGTLSSQGCRGDGTQVGIDRMQRQRR
jgi:hypothetical protein